MNHGGWGKWSYLVRSSRIILHTSNGGTDWEIQNYGTVLGQDWPLRGVSFVNATTGTVLGDQGSFTEQLMGVSTGQFNRVGQPTLLMVYFFLMPI